MIIDSSYAPWTLFGLIMKQAVVGLFLLNHPDRGVKGITAEMALTLV